MKKKWNPEFAGVYPYVTRNIKPDGSPMVVKSHKHRKKLMKQYQNRI